MEDKISEIHRARRKAVKGMAYPCKILKKLKVEPDSFSKDTQLFTRGSEKWVL